MKTKTKDLLTCIRTAELFVSWYRQMVIEGQIVTNEYAQRSKPCDDYNLRLALEFYSKEARP